MMEPALEDAGKEYKLYFKLSDLNTNDPQSNEFEVKVLVIKPFEEIIEEVVIEVVKEEVKVDIQQLDDYGAIAVRFDQSIRLAQNFEDFNESNEGANQILVEFLPTEETETLMYNRDEKIQLSWRIEKISD